MSMQERLTVAAALARVLLAERHQPSRMTPADMRHLLSRYQRCLTELVDAIGPEPGQRSWEEASSLAFRLPGSAACPAITVGRAVMGRRLYDDAGAGDPRERAVRIDLPEKPDAADGLARLSAQRLGPSRVSAAAAPETPWTGSDVHICPCRTCAGGH